MKVIIKEPNKKPYEAEIENTLETLQSLVDGKIENVYELDPDDINIWINDEGKLNRLNPNFFIYDGQDIVVGTAIFTGFNEDGENVSLTKKQKKRVYKYLSNRCLYCY